MNPLPVVIRGYTGAFVRCDLVVSAKDYDLLLAKVEELERDKARLNWLENRALGMDTNAPLWEIVEDEEWVTLRHSIDAAIQAERKGKG